jgi:TetR/AcrR family transcriptional regulator, transcriptional repressor for nem operon
MTKGERTRERIVAEAAELFNLRGFEGGSMSELMAATGLKKGGIYRHFSSKERLAAEAFDYAWRLTLDERMQDLDRIPNSVEQLKRFIANFVDSRPAIGGGCPLLNTAVDADDGNPVLRKRARKGFHDLRDRLRAIVKSGIKRGEIRQGIGAKELATLIIASLQGALAIDRLERNGKALAAARLHLERYLDSEVRRGTLMG